MSLEPCPSCHRHVRASERCPFCSGHRAPRHLAIAIAAALAGCGEDAPPAPRPSAPVVTAPPVAAPVAAPSADPAPPIAEPTTPEPVVAEVAPPDEPPSPEPAPERAPPRTRPRRERPDERPIAAYGTPPTPDDPF